MQKNYMTNIQDFYSLPFFEDQHRSLAEKISSWAKTNTISIQDEETSEEECAKSYVKKLGASGFLKFAAPKAYGGMTDKLDVRSLCICRETLGKHSALLDFSFAMQGLGSGPISLFGNKEQCERYLPFIAKGEKISAFALSEMGAGSDASQITTSAKKDGDSFILNGSKSWISNAGFADFYVVFARTGEAPGAKGLSAFIVDSDSKGFSVKERVKISSPHPVGTIEFNNCKIPAKNLLGNSGDGFKIAMATLDVFRSTVGAAALGFAKRALCESVEYAKKRKVFGETLSEFQMIQDKLATMATEVDASAMLIYRAAWLKDSGAERITKEASMAKFYATEAAQRVIDQAVQIFGGLGVTCGSIVERLYRDIRPLRIYEGTSEIQKIVIARQILKD